MEGLQTAEEAEKQIDAAIEADNKRDNAIVQGRVVNIIYNLQQRMMENRSKKEEIGWKEYDGLSQFLKVQAREHLRDTLRNLGYEVDDSAYPSLIVTFKQ